MAPTKIDIGNPLHGPIGFPRNKSLKITESLLEPFKASLKPSDDELASGVGQARVKDANERNKQNSSTGEDAILPARRVGTFNCLGQLRAKVNQK